MKARIKATGEIVNIEFIENKNISHSVNYFKTSDGRLLPDIAFEFEKAIDWEQRRFELVKAAMQGFCSNSGFVNEHFEETIDMAKYAILRADAVLSEYKKGVKQ